MKTSIQTLIIGGMLAIAVSGPVHATALLKPSSGNTQALSAKSLSINSKINGAFARTTLTTVYKNPNRQRIEADFIYSAPQGAVVTGFAYWFGKEKVVARVVEKNRAARIYEYITTRQQDPALIEMIDKNTFRARIFPVEANQDFKIEIQLAQTLESTPDGLKWNYPLQDETKNGALEKFDLSIQADGKATSNLGEFSNGKLNLKRESFKAQSDLNVEVAQNRAPLRVSLLARRENSASDGFFALSIVPSTPVVAPRFKISGVSTYDVLVPTMKRLEAGAPFLVFGRYKGSGKAVVALNNQSVALDFGAGVEQNNAASKLWAQKRIETLSESEKNRFQVVNLSSRFGIVSKWTSWLAIPSAERERFQEEVDMADRQNAGRAYAQAIARGDKKTALAQQKVFIALNKKLDEDEPLSQTLDIELDIISRSIRAANGAKISASQLALWKKMERTLVRLGARRDTDSYALAERTKAEVDKLLPQLIKEIEAGRENGVRGKYLNNRLRTLGDSRALRLHEGEFYYEENLAQLASERGEELAQTLVAERADKRLTPKREAQLMARLKRVVSLYSEEYVVTLGSQISSVQTQFVMGKTSAVRKRVIEQLKQGVPYEKAVQELDEQWANWEKRIQGQKLDKQNSNNELRSGVQQILAAEVLAKRELQPQNVQLAQALKAMGKAGYDSHGYLLMNAYDKRAKETAKALLEEELTNGDKTPVALELKTQLARLSEEANRGSSYPTDFTVFAAHSEQFRLADQLLPYVVNKTEASATAKALQTRLDKIRPKYPQGYESYHYSALYPLDIAWKGRAHETAYRLLEAQEKAPDKVPSLKNELDKLATPAKNTPNSFLEWEKARRDAGLPMLTAEQYRLRPGDPLISVVAPQNSRQVVAILPSGEVKRLVWNAANKAFEARFDVPAHATEGDYAVKILIVGADNSRRQLTLHFSVDTSAPDGKGALKFENGTAKIRLETDENTDRVSAFLPWDERVELRRNESGIFSGELQVPAEWQNKEASVRFVLTDKAHNRSEIWVSP